jgi:1,4-dihydroxy-2-naphthoyl-CoA synthase
VGARKAKEILFGNRFMTAQEAMTWGFVNQVYPAANIESETLKYASRVAEGNPYLHRTIKHAINQTLDGMGFSASVTATNPTFHNMRLPKPGGERPAPAQRDPRFRSQVGRALEYVREDRGERPNSRGD